ncbi:MAG: hypothetical protein K0U37_01025 [Gammaproteobacteria bacterium]|nr:hypothetical protein [Gammaproteobacteria bacterium]
MKHLIRKLKTYKQPRFIWSYQYFCPRLTGPLRQHRKLFFLSCKNPLHLVLNIYAYCYWVSIAAWIVSYKATLKNHQTTQKKPLFLFFELLKLSLIHNIAPRYYFKYEFYKPQNKKQAFNYFYNNQLPYFHDHTNQQFPNYKQARKLIAHKQNFAQALKKIGLPHVPGKIYDSKILEENPSILLSKQTVFCKPPSGSQSLDAFLITYSKTTQQHCITPIKKTEIQDAKSIHIYLNQIFKKHKALLVQPFIEDHPEIKKLSHQKATTTVRIITEKSKNTDPKLLYLQLEIPKVKKTSQTYFIYPLTLDTLDIDPIFKEKAQMQDEPYPVIPDTIKKELHKAIHYCIKAHQSLLDLRSVSFDVILTQDGPVMLEANYNWSIELLYHVIDNKTSHPAKIWLHQMTQYHQEQMGKD